MAPAPRGPVRAVVTETTDPLGQGRVRVTYTAGPRAHECWAPVCLPYGVAAWPLGSRPLTGDTVVLGFEDGDPDLPLVMGRLGPEQGPGDEPDELRISHAGHSIVLSGEGLRVELADGSVALVLGPTGATLDGGPALRLRADGACVISGSLITLN